MKIGKKQKIALILILSILIVISSFLLYKEINTPKFVERKIPAYSYKSKNSINYEVFLKPNQLYDKTYLEEGMLYITEYVDYIRANLNYEFDGEKSAEISGDYNIVAKVKGFTGEGESLVNVWEKDFPIINKRSFKNNDTSISINEKVNLHLEDYNVFAKEIIETSKINCSTTLNLIMSVNLKANTDKGLIEETITSDLLIPLNVSMFEIGGNNIVEKPGVIEETTNVQLTPNRNKIIIFIVVICILALALVYLIFFTIPEPVKDPLKKELNKIFKKYGDRFVALNDDAGVSLDSVSIVKSMDDLVRIADEIEEPIFYKYSKDYKDIDKFYITHGDKVYLLDLCELIPKKDSENINEQLTVNSEQLKTAGDIQKELNE